MSETIDTKMQPFLWDAQTPRNKGFTDNTAIEDEDGRALLERLPRTFEEGQRYDRAVGLHLADSLIEKFGSHERLPELLDVVDSYERPSWLWALGALWLGFDNLGIYQDDLLEELPAMG